MLVLKALEDRPNHGYGVARWVRETTDGDIAIEEGALYTALHRLARAGLLRAEWTRSDTGRRARVYALTASGRRVLREQSDTWRRSAAALFKVMGPAPGRRRS